MDALVIHRHSLNWLVDRPDAPFAGTTVVVTHHVPSLRSVNPPFHSHSATPAYASHLEWLLDGRAAVWMHGHTHVCVDYEIGGTRVVANQRGYPDDAVAGFDPGKIIVI